MPAKEALGMSMTISEEFVQNLAKELVTESLIKTLDGKETIVNEIVGQVLGMRVNRDDGSPTSSDYRSCSFLEYQIRKMLKEEIVLVTKEVMEEKRPEVRKVIKSELMKKATVDRFFNVFYDAVIGNLSNKWDTEITFNIDRKKEEY